MLQQFNYRVDELRNSIITTDNYIDKYLGFQLNKSLIQILREIYKEEDQIGIQGSKSGDQVGLQGQSHHTSQSMALIR